MTTTKFSEQHLDNIKQIIFGQQKQANVINDAVVKIIARELADKAGKDDLFTIDDVEFAIMEYLKGAVGGNAYDDTAMMLIVGEQSLANLKSDELVTVTAETASDTSTKVNFRIRPLSGADADVDSTGVRGDAQAKSYDKSAATAMRERDPNATFQNTVDDLRDKLLPMVPDAVKAEVSDPYAQALYALYAMHATQD